MCGCLYVNKLTGLFFRYFWNKLIMKSMAYCMNKLQSLV